MYRLIPAVAAGVAAIVYAAPALAADFGTFRPGLPGEWDSAEEYDPLTFEAGLRYWYSVGSQNNAVGSSEYTSQDRTQVLEGHLRIDDASTSSYVKGWAGYSIVINGEHSESTPFGDLSGTIVDGRVGYAGVDFGYTPFGTPDGSTQFGGLVGYQFWNDSPNTGRATFTTAETGDVSYDPTTGLVTGYPGDSEPNNLDIHALRLGITGRSQISEFLDVSAEVAAVPYAWVSGTLGVHGAEFGVGNQLFVNSSATTIDGSAYGAMAEAMIGLHPTENIALRFGGRAWYLQGTTSATYRQATITEDSTPDMDGNYDAPTVTHQYYISEGNPFSLFRYGALAELSVKF